jgi:hypothetical protein
VLVPLSVFMLPNSETLIPAIDKVVDRNFGMLLKVVEWQREIGAAALNHWGPSPQTDAGRSLSEALRVLATRRGFSVKTGALASWRPPGVAAPIQAPRGGGVGSAE